jgi:serine/threonine-protein kinase HipA
MSARLLPRVAQLDVETPQGHAGRLGNERGSYLFVYDRDTASQTSVSLLMPVRLTPYESGALLPVFAMNLPEGYVLSEIRERLAKVARIDPLLLLAITGDSHPIGRLTLHSDAIEKFLPDRSAVPHGETLDDILHWSGGRDLFRELVDRYVLRSGISGIQPKVVVPERGRASTAEFIVKSGRDEYPALAINEYVCMSIAKEAGLAVPEFWLSDDRELFVMRRFDADAAGARLGFEDFAALTGRQPEQKYEGSYRMLAEAIRTFVAVDDVSAGLTQLFDTVALSCAVGNGDAHLKNFGVIYTHSAASDARIAPVYDVVNTTMYIENDGLALKLGEGKSFAGRARLDDFARVCDVADADARVDRILAAAETVLAAEQPLLDDVPDLTRAIRRRLETYG